MTERHSRRALLASLGSAGAVFLAGCSDLSLFSDPGEPVTVGQQVDTVTFVGDDPPDDEPENAPPFGDRVLPLPVSPAEMSTEATDGGPNKDGIPSIDDPSFDSAVEASDLDEETIVLGVERGGEAKAYPRGILVHHEIVNDSIDGVLVSITYCPLTGTAQGFERGETEFGVSGMLVNNNLIMYDRAVERWWPQIAATSIPGEWHDTDGGATLREFEVVRTTFGQWREQYPETVVLSSETGFARDYDRDPYEQRGYYQNQDTLFGNIYENDHLHSKDWVYGARSAEGAVAFTRELVHSEGLIEGELGATPVVAVHDPRLDTAYVYRNPDREAFDHDGQSVVDDRGERFAPDELPLERLISFDAYWFAWIAYYPNTTLYE